MKEVNFDTYEIMRLAEMPKVETVIVPTYDFGAAWGSQPSAWWRLRY
jgi:isoquinoline 1-oxidoreductase beta subunit